MDDAFGAREIINGDKNIVPDWGGGQTIGEIIEGYHNAFLAALTDALIVAPVTGATVRITVERPPGIRLEVIEIEVQDGGPPAALRRRSDR
jgi:hypothetical protein